MKPLFILAFLLFSNALIAAKQPNIVWLISEDNSPLLGCYGDTLARTPNLDRLAETAVQFEHAYANAPVCAPSRSTLINGVYATELGSHHMRSNVPMPDNFQHFPWYLKQAGYFTTNRSKKDYNTPLKPNTWSKDNWYNWDDAFDGWDGHQPFFLMYNTWMSHESKIHHNPNDSLENYLAGTLKAFGSDEDPKTLMEKFSFDPAKVQLPAYHPDLPAVREDWALYYKCISLMDHEMGLALKKLEQQGLLENTIVFYFSDHGGVLPRSKRFLYESGLRVPLLIHVPKAYKHLEEKLQQAAAGAVEFVDLAPTVMELAGVEIPTYFSGTSLLQQKADAHALTFGFRGRMDERYDCVRTVTDGRYRYVRDYIPHRKEGGKVRYLWRAASMRAWENAYQEKETNEQQSAFWEPNAPEALYDCEEDPDNVRNLAADPEYAEILNHFREVVNGWMLQTKDTGLIPEPMLHHLRGQTAPWDWMRNANLPVAAILDAANLAISATENDIPKLKELSESKSPILRYWAATGFAILASKGINTEANLLELSSDAFPSIRIAVAEGFYLRQNPKKARSILHSTLQFNAATIHEEDAEKHHLTAHFVNTMAMNIIDTYETDPASTYPELKVYLETDVGYPTRMAKTIFKAPYFE